MHRVDGERFQAMFPPMVNIEDVQFYVRAVDIEGGNFTGPIGAPDVLYGFSEGLAEIVFVDVEMPEDFQLRQNYPNPFNSETTIEFDVVDETHVILRIYNILGQQIHTLVDTVLRPGRKRVVWRGTDQLDRKVPSGVYIYRMETKDSRTSRKMILVN
jgi:hypothetical protein